jgi:hypothetical protein
MHQAKATTNDTRVPEECANFFGTRARRDVEVLGSVTDEQIPYATANKLRFVASPRQTAHDFSSGIVD